MKKTDAYLAEINSFVAQCEAATAHLNRIAGARPRLVATSGRVTVSNRPRPNLTLVVNNTLESCP
jgi:hypothetical protein